MKNNYSIGRSESNDFTTPTENKYSDIGREHAQFILSAKGDVDIAANKKSYLLFVNGFRVLRKRITAQDSLQLGKAYQFRLGHYFKMNSSGAIIGERTNLNDYAEEFDALRANWEANLKAENNLKGLFNSNLRIIDFAVVFTSMGILSMIAPWASFAIFVALLPFLKTRNTKKIKQLKSKMEKEHICPKCNHYFKDLTWKEVKLAGGHHCSAKWP